MLISFPQQIPENIFTSNVRDMNLSVALGTLDVLATVLRKEKTPVASSDLLMVLQLLKEVADVEVQEREELEMLEQLGQYYMEVTELILEEQNIETWSSISQVMCQLRASSAHLLCVQVLGLQYDCGLKTLHSRVSFMAILWSSSNRSEDGHTAFVPAQRRVRSKGQLGSFKLLHFDSPDLQNCTVCGLWRYVDSLFPHPSVSGRALPVCCIFHKWLPRSCLSPDPILFKSPSNFM